MKLKRCFEMSVSAQNVIEALKGSQYIPRPHRRTQSQPCLSVALPRSTDLLDLASKLVDGGLYTDYLAELGQTLQVDRTGMNLVVFWPQLLLEPEEVQAMAGRIEDAGNDLIHYV
jgi:hypothetical protein